VKANSRLRRLVTDEVGECCDGALDDRVAGLEALDEAVPTATETDRTALGTLSDETRHRIVRLLVAAEDELCVCELSPLVDVSDSAISHALSDLTDAGLVARRKAGAWRYYRPTERAEELIATLDATGGAP
jgi:DNA-binding transcriptional ArsR family regulator